MPYPQQETLPNGTPAVFALKDPRWLKLLARRSVDPLEDSQEPQALARPVVSQPAGQPDTQPIAPPRPAFTPAIAQTDAPVERPRIVNPDLPTNRYLGSTMYPPDDSDLPVLNRNLGSSQFAPDLKTNPDYAGQGVQSPAGEAITRPKVIDKLGYAETHTPMPRHGRAYEAGKGTLLGFLGGVERTGTLGGGLGGAATLGTMSAIKPQYAEEAQNRLFTIPRLQQQEAIQVGRNETALKQQGQATDINLKRSEIYKNTHPLPDYELKDAADGSGLVAVDKRNPSAAPVKVPGARGGADNYDVYDDGKQVWAINKHNPRDRYQLSGVASKPRPERAPLVDYKAPDGKTYRVPQTFALSQMSADEAAKIEADTKTADRLWENQEDEAKRNYQVSLGHFNRGKAEADAFNAAHDKLDRDARERGALEDLYNTVQADTTGKAKMSGDQVKRYNELKGSVEADRQALEGRAAKYKQDFGDVGRFNERERIEYGEPPQEPTPIARQPVQSRRGASSQGGQFAGQRISRSKLPDAAKRWGMTPEQAESTFTQGGGVIY